MLDKFFVFVQPYVAGSHSYVKVLTPFFVLICFIIVIYQIWLKKDQDMDLVKHFITPLLIAACIFFYDTILLIYAELCDILFSNLPSPESLSFSDIWGMYKESFKTMDSFWDVLTQGLNVLSIFSTWIAVKLMILVKTLVTSLQLFFKVILYIVGPWALLFSIIPTWRKILKTWINYMVYFALWSVSLFVVDALVIALFKGVVLDASIESSATRNVAGTGVAVKGKSTYDLIKKKNPKPQDVKSAVKAWEEAKLTKNMKKGAKAAKAAKGAISIAKLTGKASIAGLAGSILIPVLILFLYFMVPSITRFFFMTTGMETVLTAGVAFVSTKLAQAQKIGGKAGTAAGKAEKTMRERAKSIQSNMRERSEKKAATKHIQKLNSQISKIREAASDKTKSSSASAPKGGGGSSAGGSSPKSSPAPKSSGGASSGGSSPKSNSGNQKK